MKAKWIYDSKLAKLLTPLGTCHTITLGWWVLTEKSKEEVSERLIRHEMTHVAQFNECFIAGLALCVVWAYFGAYWAFIPSLLLFYTWYAVEWLVRLIMLRDWHKAYKALSFEREANVRQELTDGTPRHSFFAWLKYCKKGGSE